MPLTAGAGGKTKPNVTFKQGSYNVSENTSFAAITVTLSAKSQSSLTVRFRTAGGTATGGASCTPGVDYITTDSQLTFNPGQTQLTAQVPICNDTLDEPNETVTLQLYNPSGNLSLGSKSQSTLTIVDDDPSVGLSVSDASVNEGDAVMFNVMLSSASAQTVAVNWTTAANGTASAAFLGASDNVCGPPSNPDYISASGALAFAPGEMSKQVSITTCVDQVTEPDETFTLNLSSPINATIADGTGVGTIVDLPVCFVKNTTTNATYTDVQSAVDAASSGDELDITGTCTESVLIKDKTVNLTGTPTMPQATLVGRLQVGINNGGDPGQSTVTNMTITGSGIEVDGSTLVLKNSLVTGNSSEFGGGGGINVNAAIDASLTLDNTDVMNNSSGGAILPPIGCPFGPTVVPGEGGGIAAHTLFGTTARIILKGDSDITGNTAEPGVDCDGITPLPGEGGAIFGSGNVPVTFISWTGKSSGNSPSTDQC